MFRVKAHIDPELLEQAHPRQVKTGLPGVAYVRLDPRPSGRPICRSSCRNDASRIAARRRPGRVVARLRDVSLRYGKTRALDAINLDLPAGCMVGLIGPDGVGKSSLLSLIAGARRIQRGRSRCSAATWPTARHRRAVCPRIAYMPQGLGKNLYPTLSVFENIDFFARLFGHGRAERARRIAELLAAPAWRPSPTGRPASCPAA